LFRPKQISRQNFFENRAGGEPHPRRKKNNNFKLKKSRKKAPNALGGDKRRPRKNRRKRKKLESGAYLRLRSDLFSKFSLISLYAPVSAPRCSSGLQNPQNFPFIFFKIPPARKKEKEWKILRFLNSAGKRRRKQYRRDKKIGKLPLSRPPDAGNTFTPQLLTNFL